MDETMKFLPFSHEATTPRPFLGGGWRSRGLDHYASLHWSYSDRGNLPCVTPASKTQSFKDPNLTILCEDPC